MSADSQSRPTAPEAVHPEYDHPTPANLDDWTDEQVDEYNRRKRTSLRADLEDEVGLSEAEQQARETLLEAGRETAMVDLHGVNLEVKTEIGGQTERKLRRLSPEDSIDETLETLLDIFEAVVIGPEGYGSRRAWRDVYEVRGSAFLLEALDVVTTPALEHMESLQSFRGE